MDFAIYSKGPGVAATIWLGTHLFGVNEFGIRVFSPLLALGTALLMFWLRSPPLRRIRRRSGRC